MTAADYRARLAQAVQLAGSALMIKIRAASAVLAQAEEDLAAGRILQAQARVAEARRIREAA